MLKTHKQVLGKLYRDWDDLIYVEINKTSILYLGRWNDGVIK